MAETLQRRRTNKKVKQGRSALKIFIYILIITLIILTIFLGIGFFKKDNIKNTNGKPTSFPVKVQN